MRFVLRTPSVRSFAGLFSVLSLSRPSSVRPFAAAFHLLHIFFRDLSRKAFPPCSFAGSFPWAALGFMFRSVFWLNNFHRLFRGGNFPRSLLPVNFCFLSTSAPSSVGALAGDFSVHFLSLSLSLSLSFSFWGLFLALPPFIGSFSVL